MSINFTVSKDAILGCVEQARVSGDLGHIAMAMRKCPPGSKIAVRDTKEEPNVHIYVDGYQEAEEGQVDWTGVHTVIIIDDPEMPMETSAVFDLADCIILERFVTEAELEKAMKGAMS